MLFDGGIGGSAQGLFTLKIGPLTSPRSCDICGGQFQPRSGSQKFCPTCKKPAYREGQRIWRRKFYYQNREKEIKKVRLWQQKNSERYHSSRREYELRKLRRAIPLVIGHYSGGTFGCACCGQKERDFLTIDHVKGNGNRESKELGIPRGGSPLYRWLVRNGYPPGYQVLCINCNMSKAKNGVCVHRRKKDDIQRDLV